MNNIAETLDFLQGENYIHYGYLIPSLVSIKVKLENLLKSTQLKLCKPLLEGIISSLKRRFKSFFDIEYEGEIAAVAAVLHPRFKFEWTAEYSQDLKLKVVNLINQAVREIEVPYEEESPIFTDNFFVFGNDETNSSNEMFDKLESKILKNYLQASITPDISVVKRHNLIEELFIKFNTPIPSSAPIERIFSYATMLNVPKFNWLSDGNFEKRVLLKCNNKY